MFQYVRIFLRVVAMLLPETRARHDRECLIPCQIGNHFLYDVVNVCFRRVCMMGFFTLESQMRVRNHSIRALTYKP